MNVREFRAKISEMNKEPIEVVRYSETIGFWVPQGMTLEPKTKTRAFHKLSETDIEAMAEIVREIMATPVKVK